MHEQAATGRGTRVPGLAQAAIDAWWVAPAIVAALTAAGTAIRLVVLQDSLVGDELSTYWIVSTHGLRGVVDTVHTDAEITPPLYFVLAWLTTRIDMTAEMLRLPSFIAGVAAIPLTYLVGLRAIGRWAGVVAAGLVALSPFMIFYSTEARGYELMTVLVLGATFFLLAGVDRRRTGWWLGYAACSCAAMYTHYTAAFVLAAQLLWVLWAYPEARRAALLANVGAAVAFAPWITGVIADLNSPTTRILSALEPFNLHEVGISLDHWSIGYPFAFPTTRLTALPGRVAIALILVGLALGAVGLAIARARTGRWRRYPYPRRLVLVVLLAIATPLGTAAVSLVGSDIFGTRNIAASWPGLALTAAALVVAPQRPVRLVAVGMVLAGFAIGASKMLETQFQRPDFAAVADAIQRDGTQPKAVVDAAPLTPGPLTSLDVYLGRASGMLRAGVPQESNHPFTFADPIVSPAGVARGAARAAADGPIFVVSPPFALGHVRGSISNNFAARVVAALSPGYHKVNSMSYPGILDLEVREYARGAGAGGG